MMIAGFILAHLCLLAMLLGFILPRYYDCFIPPSRQGESTQGTIPNEPRPQDVGQSGMTSFHGTEIDAVPAGSTLGDIQSLEFKSHTNPTGTKL